MGLSFGKANESLYQGDIHWNNLVDTGYWQIELQDLLVNDTAIGLRSDSVAVDTGTSLIGAPHGSVDGIFDQIPGSRPSEDPMYEGYYIFPCTTEVRVSMTFGGQTWPISSSDFNLGRVSTSTSGVEDDSMCLAAVFTLDDPTPST